MLVLIILSFFADSVRVDTNLVQKPRIDTALMLGKAFTQQSVQKIKIDQKLNAMLQELKKDSTKLKAIRSKVKKK